MENKELIKIVREAVEEIIFNTAYQYKSISPPEILRAKKGIIGLAGMNVLGQNQARQRKAMHNRQIIEEYLNEMGRKGWELVTDINYANLPYGGNIVFKRPIKKGDEEVVFGTEEITKEEESFDRDSGIDGMTSYERKQKAREQYIHDKRAKRGLVKKKTITLEDRFNEETGKNAIFRGRETKGFLMWKERFMNKLKDGDDIGVSKKEEAEEFKV